MFYLKKKKDCFFLSWNFFYFPHTGFKARSGDSRNVERDYSNIIRSADVLVAIDVSRENRSLRSRLLLHTTLARRVDALAPLVHVIRVRARFHV